MKCLKQGLNHRKQYPRILIPVEILQNQIIEVLHILNLTEIQNWT